MKRTTSPVVAEVLSTNSVLWEEVSNASRVNVVVVSTVGVERCGWHRKSNVLSAEMLTAVIFFEASLVTMGTLKEISANFTAFSSRSLKGCSGYKSV